MPTQPSVLETVGAQAAPGEAVFELFREMSKVRMAEHEMLEKIDLDSSVNNSRCNNEANDGKQGGRVSGAGEGSRSQRGSGAKSRPSGA